MEKDFTLGIFGPYIMHTQQPDCSVESKERKSREEELYEIIDDYIEQA